jgi:hypothetical protein
MWPATFDADNRLARGLEAEWENCLREVDKAKAELAHREALRPRTLSPDERSGLLALGTDLLKVWQAPTTLPRDKKELLRTVLEEVIITVDKERRCAHLTLRWRGGALSEIDTDLPPRRSAPIRTAEDTVALVRRLAAHYPDAVIAGILNRQERRTAYGHRFTAGHVGTLRRRYNIPIFERPSTKLDGELMNIRQAADALGVATSLGLDHCEARSWHAWHRHMSLVMTALAFLAKLRADLLRSTVTGTLPSKRNERSPSAVALAS